ncbi:MAG: AAA family ATPase [Candidatus Binatia bacterium]
MNAEHAGMLPIIGIPSRGRENLRLPMYNEYFGFREDPFSDTADLRFFYTNPVYQKAYTTLLSGIREYKGFLLLTGETGTGKTTLLRRVMQDLEASGHCVFFDSTSLSSATFDDLLYFICTELGLHGDDDGRVQKLRMFSAYLNALVNKGGTGVLFVDEAQHLSDEVLGNLRLLTPVDMKNEKLLLQVVLVGQPELEEKLEQPSLRPIKQRIALRCRLDRLADHEVESFIQHRLRVVGYEDEGLFAPDAVQRIIHYAKGVPRLVNILCDNALFSTYKKSQSIVSASIIEEVVANFHLRNGTADHPVSIPPVLAFADGQSVRSGQLTEALGAPQPLSLPDADAPEPTVDLATFRTSSSLYLLAIPAFVLLLAVGGLYYYWWKLGFPPLLRSTPLPVITRAEPSKGPDQVFIVREGQKQVFAIEATSVNPVPLQYIWLLDGEEQGRGQRWVYQPQQTDRGKLKTVTVQIRDSENQIVEQSWRIRVYAVSSLSRDSRVTWTEQTAVVDPTTIHPSLENQLNKSLEVPPVHIIQAQPPTQELQVQEGKTLAFAVTAEGPSSDLQYVWLLDGKAQAREPRWTYHPQFDEGGAQRMVTVQVRSPDDRVVERNWRVQVQDVNRPPEIAGPVPLAATVEIQAGLAQRFAVEVKDPDTGDRLETRWLLDGKEIAKGIDWTFTPALPRAAQDQQHRVAVSVSDQGGATVERRWLVTVLAPTPPPLQIARVNPIERTLIATEGQKIVFDVAIANRPPGVQYVWSLDGQEQARGPTWTYQPLFDEDLQRKTVSVRVSDTKKQIVEHSWQIQVPPLARAASPPPAPLVVEASVPSVPPRILQTRPDGERVVVDAGTTMAFSVVADLPHRSHEENLQLRYQWHLDDTPPRTTNTGQFDFRGEEPARRQLTAVVISPDGVKSLPRKWTIEIRPPQAVPPTIDVPPLALSEEEIREWLETQRQALEAQDVKSLVKLGALDEQHAERAQEILSQYRSFRVEFKNVRIRRVGEQVEVSFSRIDTIEGQEVPHPDRKRFVLEKGAGGYLTARPQ